MGSLLASLALIVTAVFGMVLIGRIYMARSMPTPAGVIWHYKWWHPASLSAILTVVYAVWIWFRIALGLIAGAPLLAGAVIIFTLLSLDQLRRRRWFRRELVSVIPVGMVVVLWAAGGVPADMRTSVYLTALSAAASFYIGLYAISQPQPVKAWALMFRSKDMLAAGIVGLGLHIWLFRSEMSWLVSSEFGTGRLLPVIGYGLALLGLAVLGTFAVKHSAKSNRPRLITSERHVPLPGPHVIRPLADD